MRRFANRLLGLLVVGALAFSARPASAQAITYSGLQPPPWGYIGMGAATPISVSTVSAQATVIGGAWYLLTCDSAVYIRFGTGTVTAVSTTDVQLFGPGWFLLGVPAGANALAVVMGSGTGSCRLILTSPTP